MIIIRHSRDINLFIDFVSWHRIERHVLFMTYLTTLSVSQDCIASSGGMIGE
jgi:hypothetical protein